jgi:hypothetical protein
MRCFFLLSLIVLVFTNAFSQKSVEFKFSDDQLKMVKINSISQEKVYKFKGKADSTLFTQSSFKQSDNDYIIEHGEMLVDKKPIAFEISCKFNQDGNPIKRSFWHNTPTNARFEEYEYNSAGKSTVIVAYDNDTAFVDITQRFYDDNGRCVKLMSSYNQRSRFIGLKISSPLSLRDSFFYTKDGQLNEMRHYNVKGDPDESYFYDYTGTDGQTITITEQANNTQHITSKNKYNKDNMLISSMDSPFIDSFKSPLEKQVL